MKYQHILNGELLFETNDTTEYFQYLLSKGNTQLMHSVLYRLIDQSGGYIADMSQASFEPHK